MILQVKLNFLSYPSECEVFNQLDCKMILHYCLFFFLNSSLLLFKFS